MRQRRITNPRSEHTTGTATDLDRESFAACLAELLGVGAETIPQGSSDPILEADEWLAARGFGLVPVLEPATFGWGGRWLGRTSEGTTVLAFGAPPGIIFNPAQAQGPVVEGWVVAPLRSPALGDLPPAVSATFRGTVTDLFIAPQAATVMQRVAVARAHAGRGLDGDRYFTGEGTFSNPAGTGHDLTLIEAEVLEAIGLDGAEARRNVVTRGIELDGLIGRRFRIGEVECLGRRRCEPCAHLQRLTRPGILGALVHRGGLRADVVTSGRLALADPVQISPALRR